VLVGWRGVLLDARRVSVGGRSVLVDALALVAPGTRDVWPNKGEATKTGVPLGRLVMVAQVAVTEGVVVDATVDVREAVNVGVKVGVKADVRVAGNMTVTVAELVLVMKSVANAARVSALSVLCVAVAEPAPVLGMVRSGSYNLVVLVVEISKGRLNAPTHVTTMIMTIREALAFTSEVPLRAQ
jgi:hypothetical protein